MGCIQTPAHPDPTPRFSSTGGIQVATPSISTTTAAVQTVLEFIPVNQHRRAMTRHPPVVCPFPA